MTKEGAWKLRAVQLDLARQMETVEEIQRFIDVACRFGFNAVALYLEGRIRTEAFPWPSCHESYTPEEIRNIVAYATERNVDLIPVVSTLGHTELFLCHDELKPLAELREGKRGRFQSGLCEFCPSQEETYEFLGKYLREIAELFPSQYFHIGCDEVWDMGSCSHCAKRIRNGESLDSIYGKHVKRIHQILSGQLGRTIMMWDDMLEELPSALDLIPSDVIQCVWQYDTWVDQTKTHFGRRARDHRLAEYDRRGIPYLIVPWVRSGVRNTESFTQYARQFQPMGGLLTLWEGYSMEDHVGMAFAGRLWNRLHLEESEKIFFDAIVELFGWEDSGFLQALWTAKSCGPLAKADTPADFLKSGLTPYTFERANLAKLLIVVLSSHRKHISTEHGLRVLDDILLEVRRELVQFRIREVIHGFYEGWNKGCSREELLLSKGRELLEELSEIEKVQLADWDRRRAGISRKPGQNSDSVERRLLNSLNDFLDSVEAGEMREIGMLSIRYCLPDFYGSATAQWSVIYEGESDWVLIERGIPKPSSNDYSECPYFTVLYPLPCDRRPLRARLQVTGYGGLGVTYVQACIGGFRFQPNRTEVIGGEVRNCDALLTDDTGVCWLGDSRTAHVFCDRLQAEAVHSMEITFASQLETC